MINFTLQIFNQCNEESSYSTHICVILAIITNLIHFLSHIENQLNQLVSKHIILSQESFSTLLNVVSKATNHIFQEFTTPIFFASLE